MLPEAIVCRSVGKASLNDGFLLSDVRMLVHVVVGIAETQHVYMVVESAILLLEDLRDICLSIAAHFGHIAQRKMRIQEKLSSDQGQLNTLDDFLAGLVGNISGLSPLFGGLIAGRNVNCIIRPLFGNGGSQLGGGNF